MTSAPTPTTTQGCSADNDPLTVAKALVVAAETGDQATIARCTYPATLGPDHQGGLQIAVTLEPDGLRYVTDALGYASA